MRAWHAGGRPDAPPRGLATGQGVNSCTAEHTAWLLVWRARRGPTTPRSAARRLSTRCARASMTLSVLVSRTRCGARIRAVSARFRMHRRRAAPRAATFPPDWRRSMPRCPPAGSLRPPSPSCSRPPPAPAPSPSPSTSPRASNALTSVPAGARTLCHTRFRGNLFSRVVSLSSIPAVIFTRPQPRTSVSIRSASSFSVFAVRARPSGLPSRRCAARPSPPSSRRFASSTTGTCAGCSLPPSAAVRSVCCCGRRARRRGRSPRRGFSSNVRAQRPHRTHCVAPRTRPIRWTCCA